MGALPKEYEHLGDDTVGEILFAKVLTSEHF